MSASLLRKVSKPPPAQVSQSSLTLQSKANASFRLWHQLTDTVFTFFEDPESKPYRLDVFNNFVRDFETKLNPLRLIEMAVIVSKEIDNPQTHLDFLTSLLDRVSQPQAIALLLATLAHAKLLYGDMTGTKTDIDKCSKVRVS
jgi:26S proteasome regulatory subunit N9